MGKTTGFMDYQRKTSAELEPLARLEHFNEFHVWPAPGRSSRPRRPAAWTAACPFARQA